MRSVQERQTDSEEAKLNDKKAEIMVATRRLHGRTEIMQPRRGKKEALQHTMAALNFMESFAQCVCLCFSQSSQKSLLKKVLNMQPCNVNLTSVNEFTAESGLSFSLLLQKGWLFVELLVFQLITGYGLCFSGDNCEPDF